MKGGNGQPNAEDAKVPQRSQSEMEVENDVSHAVIGAAIEVQRVLGTGLLESAYANALAIELAERELGFVREAPIEGVYKGWPLGVAYRADFIVERKVIIELKAMDRLDDAHRAQLLSYLRVTQLKLGLLINFHAFPLAKGIHRLVNHL